MSNSLQFAEFPNATLISETAFENCSSLISADFPLATEIKRKAFYNCSSLVSVNIPLTKTIRFASFWNCISLESVDFPFVNYIGNGGPQSEDIYCFYGCTGLSSVRIGTGFTEETEVFVGYAVFTAQNPIYISENIELTLGSKVIPKPNIETLT